MELDRIVPDFTLPATSGKTFVLSELRGSKVVLFFYPKDNTPGCTTESAQFRDHHPEFIEAGCAVFGISRDSLRSHENFKSRLELPFELLSDVDERVCNLFAVIKEKNMYGKKVRGIERSTFLIDGQGVLRQAWRGVKVSEHVQAVLDAVRGL
ncbi:MAG: peroxiredoxin [Betaproteobacteria bacterium]|nr:peroxiredoxin [Rhodocyclaceae bacterium]